jgi:DNA modification methylase
VFDDAWPSLDAWLDMLYPRLRLVYSLLAPTGSQYLHLDWRAAHYARVVLDEIFGAEAFRNEIIWKRAASLGRKAASGQYGRVTDHLLFYTKGDQFTFNTQSAPRPVNRRDALWDEAAGRWFRTSPPGDYTEANLARLAAAGRIHETRSGRRRVKYFLDETLDGRLVDHAPLDNLWLDIPDMMHLPPAQRTGYPTQKPLALLQRILAVSSNPGDLVLDPFMGGGTTLVAAAGLGRRWLGIDASPAGLAVSRARLLAQGARPFAVYGVGDREEREEGEGGTPEFVVTSHQSSVSITLTGETSQVEYWAVDWAYEGVFRSRWQGWRGYSRGGAALPTQANTQAEVGKIIAVRWEWLDGTAGLCLFEM